MKIQITIPTQSIEVELDCAAPPPPPPPPPTDPGFKVGCCSFPWFPQGKFADIGIKWQRVYCSSGWIWQPGGLAVQPMHQAETSETHGIDDMLERAKGLGINTVLCIHQTPEWYLPTGRGDGANDFAPCKPGSNRKDPESYADYAEMLFQVAARYGRVKHQETALRVDATPRWNNDVLNEKKSGLNLLTHIEVWNEPDKWWKRGSNESNAYFEPEETAALMSVCYNAIKRADPSMQVVMPGITDFDMQYVLKMSNWFYEYRQDKSWPCDVMNFHHYSNVGNLAGQYPAQWKESGACMPDADKNFHAVNSAVSLAASIGKKCWVTEFGADKRAPSMMHAKGVGKTDAEFQAEIILESIKAYKLANVDGVFVFNACDENSGADGGQYESSGIFTSQADGYKPTPASEALRAYLKPGSRFVTSNKLPKISHSKRRE